MSPARPKSADFVPHFETLEPRMLLDSQVGIVAMPFDGYLSAGIYDASGQLIRTLLARAPEQAGNVTLTWDGKDAYGRLVTLGGNYTWKALVSQVEVVEEGGVGDSSVKNGDIRADAGYTVQSVAVNVIPGTTGEGGGVFAQNDGDSYYGDTSLSQTYTLNSVITGSGDFVVPDCATLGDLYGGGRFFMGHFSSSTASNRREFMGLEFQPGDAHDRIGVSATIFHPVGDISGASRSAYVNILAGSGQYHFTYSYDPNYEADASHSGPEGRLSVHIFNNSGHDYTLTATLTGQQRTYGSSFDSFGMGISTMQVGYIGDNPAMTATVYADNLSYSGHAGVVDFQSDPGWTASGNASDGNDYGWRKVDQLDDSLYSTSYLEENSEIRKIGQDGSTRWDSWDALNFGIAADGTYTYVTRHANIQTVQGQPAIYEDRLFRYWARDGAPAPFSPGMPYLVINTDFLDPAPADQLALTYTAQQWRELSSTWGIAADGYRVWVSDYRNDRVIVYHKDSGQKLGQFSVSGPMGVAIDTSITGEASVWVANSGDRVSRYERDLAGLLRGGFEHAVGGVA